MERLLNSLQRIAENSDDAEVQLASQTARQFKVGRHRSPNYEELATQRSTRCTNIIDATTLQYSF